ncbi:sodium:proton antiporter [Arenicella chitinivorans]|uniref:Sodium:proton antiporter n=1 Tax=Arenicella chitinivorans TaxID=1329800 RepID=A0A918RNG4_9GAMM|nr:Na+/H+ antiporter NhaC family protein [Arenicella chitinivorans]GHA05114.1 sodium:proton antiporter [Arenicella chitinivorans]
MDIDTTSAQRSTPDMPLWLAFLPVLVLISALSWNVWVYGDDALSGSTQVIIILVTGFAAAIGLLRGTPWHKQQVSVIATISNAMPSILILMLVGALASIWLLCGTVPMLVYYGVKILNPTIFLLACCIACALTSLMSGGSWSTAATIGLAMVGVGRALEIPDGLIGGAIISGAYFGDKISPLSDTTNLAAAVTETPLFTHIRYLFLTTGPSMGITLVLFTVIGLNIDTSATEVDVANVLGAIEQRFNIHIGLLLPPIITLGLIMRRVDAIPALFAGVLAGIACALLFQRELVADLMQPGEPYALYSIIMTTLFGGVDIPTNNEMLNDLFSASGMRGMLETVWLILAAMAFGGVMEACGMLQRIMEAVKSLVSGFFSLVACTAGTCIVTNLSTSDQYISVAIPGRMYAGLYKEMGYKSENLSRTLEDTGTVTSVLIPWNTCGAYHAAVLGIGTMTYLPFCFFNLLSPLMTLLFAWFMIKIRRLEPIAENADEAVRA